MNYWQLFWTASLIVAGAAFAFITVVVIVKGGPDLRDTLRQIQRQQRPR
jgi:hypothetical protein